MNNFFVESLNYKLKHVDEISFENPPSLEEDYQSFKLLLVNGLLVIEMKDYFETEQQARLIVEPYIKAWELDNFLNQGRKEIWFEFIDSKIVESNRTRSNGSVNIYPKTGELIYTGFAPTIHITRNKYPTPPRNLCYTNDVESLLKRYEGFQKGNEPLLSMAYFCLTIIVSIANNRSAAGKIYNIDKDVLDKLGELTSERGDKSEARKAKGGTSFNPLTESEKTWINETIKLLIRRKAEYDFDNNAKLSEITLNILPVI